MVAFSLSPQVEFGRTDHREYALHFIKYIMVITNFWHKNELLLYKNLGQKQNDYGILKRKKWNSYWRSGSSKDEK